MAMTTRADKRGDVYVINGKKHWITRAGVSRLHFPVIASSRRMEQAPQ
jgi:alkylation response protein AidB-like acyl-CoA dehydrogenase